MWRIRAVKSRMIIAVLGGLVALDVILSISSAAVGDELTPLYGNTLIATDRGVVSHFWYKPDRTFSGTVPSYSFALKGTWTRIDDGTICRNFDPPLPTVKNPDCGKILVRKVGDKQTGTEGHSEMLVAGVR